MHLRYEAAWHLAWLGGAFKELLGAPNADVAPAGLTAVDVACFGNFPTEPEALAALKAARPAPGSADSKSLLTLVQMDGDVTFGPAIESLLAKPDLPPAVVCTQQRC